MIRLGRWKIDPLKAQKWFWERGNRVKQKIVLVGWCYAFNFEKESIVFICSNFKCKRLFVNIFNRPSPSTQASTGAAQRQATTPPRQLTARTWTAAAPTILSHSAFTKLCSPAPMTSASIRRSQPVMLSPLERFLCCVHLKRHLTRVVQNEESVSSWGPTDK